jgi:hypothetical protein
MLFLYMLRRGFNGKISGEFREIVLFSRRRMWPIRTVSVKANASRLDHIKAQCKLCSRLTSVRIWCQAWKGEMHASRPSGRYSSLWFLLVMSEERIIVKSQAFRGLQLLLAKVSWLRVKCTLNSKDGTALTSITACIFINHASERCPQQHMYTGKSNTICLCKRLSVRNERCGYSPNIGSLTETKNEYSNVQQFARVRVE